MVTVYGIPTCGSCRKALDWLKSHGVTHRFHDLRKDGFDPAWLVTWESAFGWTAMLNKHSSTWRALADADKASLNREQALALMQQHPTLIKRPLLVTQRPLLLGFDAQAYQCLLPSQ